MSVQEHFRKAKIRRDKFVPTCRFCGSSSDYYTNIDLYYAGKLPTVEGVCSGCKHLSPLGVALTPVQEEWKKARRHAPAKSHEEKKDDEPDTPIGYWSDRWLGADVRLLRPSRYSQRFMTDRFYVRDRKEVFVDLVCHDGREQKVEVRQFVKDFALVNDHDSRERLIGKKYRMKKDFCLLGNYGTLKGGDVVKIEGFETRGDSVGEWNVVRFEDNIGSGNAISEEAFFHDFERVPHKLEDIVDVKVGLTKTPAPAYNPKAVELRLDEQKVEGIVDHTSIYEALRQADPIPFTEAGIEEIKASLQKRLDREMDIGTITNFKIESDPVNQTINFEADMVPALNEIEIHGDIEFDEKGDPKMVTGLKEALDKMLKQMREAGLIVPATEEKNVVRLIKEETHSFSMRFPNGDVVNVPPPTGENWKEEPILDDWTERDPDEWPSQIVNAGSSAGIWIDKDDGDPLEIIHLEGKFILKEYVARTQAERPQILSLSKWTRTVTVETKTEETAFPTLSGTFEI